MFIPNNPKGKKKKEFTQVIGDFPQQGGQHFKKSKLKKPNVTFNNKFPQNPQQQQQPFIKKFSPQNVSFDQGFQDDSQQQPFRKKKAVRNRPLEEDSQDQDSFLHERSFRINTNLIFNKRFQQTPQNSFIKKKIQPQTATVDEDSQSMDDDNSFQSQTLGSSSTTSFIHNTIQTSVPQLSTQEIQNLFREHAIELEKLKASRSNKKIQSISLTEAQENVGTCQFMCSKFEAITREQTKDLDEFEMMPETKHSRTPIVKFEWAVKKYKRAVNNFDNTESVSIEDVRPPYVLKKTMDFLLDVALNRDEFPLHKKYHFIFNRTRAIRSDITFQNSVSQTSIEILEQIARFHIIMGYQLCNQHDGLIDLNQNLEQLQKCLLSLRYSYDSQKSNIEFPNENLFRSYFILSQIHYIPHTDYEVSTEEFQFIQEMSSDLCSSPEVKLVLEIWGALLVNNYVKFFQIVKKMDYVTACLLHIHFNNVRGKALKTLVSIKPNDITYDTLTRLLLFENEIEAKEFCKYHGVILGGKLIGTEFQKPENPFQKRTYAFIDSKLNGTLQDVIRGNIPSHKPSSIVYRKPSQQRFQPENPPPWLPQNNEPFIPPTTIFNPHEEQERIKMQQLEEERRQFMERQKLEERMRQEELARRKREEETEIEFKKVREEREIKEREDNERQERENRERQEKERKEKEIQEKERKIMEELRKEKERKKKEKQEKILKASAIFERFIARNYLSQLKKRHSRIQAVCRRMRLHFSFQKWLEFSVVKKAIGKSLIIPNFNKSSNVTTPKVVTSLTKPQDQRSPQEWEPFHLPNLIYEPLQHRNNFQNTCLYWKLVICSPEESLDESIFIRWIVSKFSSGKVSFDHNCVSILSFYTFQRNQIPLKVCIKFINLNAIQEEDFHAESYASQGFILGLSYFDPRFKYSISKLLSFASFNTPLLVLLPDKKYNSIQNKQTLKSQLGLDPWKLFDVCVPIHADQMLAEPNSQILSEGLFWLVKNSPIQPNLLSGYLGDLVESHLNDLVRPLYSYGSSLSPSNIINAYNQALFSLRDQLTDPRLKKIQWPIPDFLSQIQLTDESTLNWNLPSTFKMIEQYLDEAILPPFPEVEDSLLEAFGNYIYEVTRKNETEYLCLVAEMNRILHSYSVEMQYETLVRNEGLIPWHLLFERLFMFQLQIFNSFSQKVYYLPSPKTETLEWKVITNNKKKRKEPVLGPSSVETSEIPPLKIAKISKTLWETLLEEKQESKKLDKTLHSLVPPQPSTPLETPTSLLEKIKQDLQENAKFEEYLQDSLKISSKGQRELALKYYYSNLHQS